MAVAAGQLPGAASGLYRALRFDVLVLQQGDGVTPGDMPALLDTVPRALRSALMRLHCHRMTA